MFTTTILHYFTIFNWSDSGSLIDVHDLRYLSISGQLRNKTMSEISRDDVRKRAEQCPENMEIIG